MKNFSIIALFMSIAFVVASCSKDDDSVCFENELAGNYVGKLVQGFSPSNNGRITIKKNSCNNLTIQATSPTSKTYTVSSITAASAGSYVGKTSASEDVAIEFNKGISPQTIKITIGGDFAFEGRKE